MWQGQEGLRDRECVVVSVSLKKEQCSRLFFFFSLFFLSLALAFLLSLFFAGSPFSSP